MPLKDWYAAGGSIYANSRGYICLHFSVDSCVEAERIRREIKCGRVYKTRGSEFGWTVIVSKRLDLKNVVETLAEWFEHDKIVGLAVDYCNADLSQDRRIIASRISVVRRSSKE